jgi:hypothetical protein
MDWEVTRERHTFVRMLASSIADGIRSIASATLDCGGVTLFYSPQTRQEVALAQQGVSPYFTANKQGKKWLWRNKRLRGSWPTRLSTQLCGVEIVPASGDVASGSQDVDTVPGTLHMHLQTCTLTCAMLFHSVLNFSFLNLSFVGNYCRQLPGVASVYCSLTCSLDVTPQTMEERGIKNVVLTPLRWSLTALNWLM